MRLHKQVEALTLEQEQLKVQVQDIESKIVGHERTIAGLQEEHAALQAGAREAGARGTPTREGTGPRPEAPGRGDGAGAEDRDGRGRPTGSTGAGVAEQNGGFDFTRSRPFELYLECLSCAYI